MFEDYFVDDFNFESYKLICGLTGWFGGQWYYRSNYKYGIASTLFFWTLVPLIYSLFELYSLMNDPQAKLNARYTGLPDKLGHLVASYLIGDLNRATLQDAYEYLKANQILTEEAMLNSSQTWSNRALEKGVEESMIDLHDIDRWLDFYDWLGWNSRDLEARNLLNPVLLARIVLAKRAGMVMSGISQGNSTGFILTANETLYWIFDSSRCDKVRQYNRWNRSSYGASYKLWDGFWIRSGRSSGAPVEEKSVDPLGAARLGVSDKYLFLSTAVDNFKIPIKKLISVESYTNALVIHQDHSKYPSINFYTGEAFWIKQLVT